MNGRALFVATSLALLAPGPAGAFEILGEPLVVRFDNTLRYNLGLRTDPVDAEIGTNPGFTNGEYSVAQGGLSANRLDLLSELDVSYEGRLGARVSAAAWYDQAYASGKAHGSPALAAAGIPGAYVDDRYSDYTLHRYRGPWGELLDAFGFVAVDVAGVPVTVKVGRHAIAWGESLMLSGAVHGVGYAQTPLDLQKGFATPGVEAKELFRPIANVYVQAQVTPALSLAAQYFLEWESYLYPEGGTFLAGGDATFKGPDGVYRPPTGPGAPAAYLPNRGASEPRNRGEWGVAVRWGPAWLDATLGLYYRHYSDKFAAVLLTNNPGGAGPLSPALNAPFQLRPYYGEGIDLLGASVAKQLLGASVGADVSIRLDTPLLAQTLGYAVAPNPGLLPVLFPHGAPRLVGNTYQARGDTFHAVVNAVGVLPRLPVASTVAWAMEVTYSRWLRVRDNPDMFYGDGHGVCREDAALGQLARTRSGGCASRGAVGGAVGVTPTWLRVFSGVDLLAPLTFSWTIAGNSPVTFGGNEGSGTWGVGVAADVRNRYRFDLRYVDFFGSVQRGTIPIGGVPTPAVVSANGVLALLQSRGSVTLTAKATF